MWYDHCPAGREEDVVLGLFDGANELAYGVERPYYLGNRPNAVHHDVSSGPAA